MKETEGAQGLCVSLAVELLLMVFFEVDVCVKKVLCFLSFSDVCTQLWCVCLRFLGNLRWRIVVSPIVRSSCPIVLSVL